ncbi:sensor histidine kinase [Deinococcus misasensis]|uniref:sensor histidine kinase n=1 Tax=Deinococcus misasensis TaxID=392413 RepID=UPI00055260DB|nr:sensor histidine kinase [Deinococcus misasensis]
MAEISKNFEVDARMIPLLGDHLIKDPSLAVFELIKNAYDADAATVYVDFIDFDDPNKARIIISDDGTGMNLETINNVWLKLGINHKMKSLLSNTRTTKYHRLPLGGKGIGRFSVHKLGRKITLHTKSENDPEISLKINWEEFNRDVALHDIPVVIETDLKYQFAPDQTGTFIEISSLRDEWSVGQIKNLHNSIASIISPFKNKSDFNIYFNIDPMPEGYVPPLGLESIREFALFHIRGVCNEINNRIKYVYEYKFQPYKNMLNKISPRYAVSEYMDIKVKKGEQIPDTLKGIGKFEFEFMIFDRDNYVIKLYNGNKKDLKDYLDQNGGVRVYRDGIRIFNYGEKGVDWLSLDVNRVNSPTKRISNNIILGSINLRYPDSEGLIEKTNREGFIENEKYDAFTKIVASIISDITLERNKDKDKIRMYYKTSKINKNQEDLSSEFKELREMINSGESKEAIDQHIKYMEFKYNEFKSSITSAAQIGAGLSLVIHEVEKGISSIRQLFEEQYDYEIIREKVYDISKIVDNLSGFIRNDNKKKEKLKKIVDQSIFNLQIRMKRHGIKLSKVYDENISGIEIDAFRMLMISITNIIENAVWWTSRYSEDKMIYIEITDRINGNPMIIIADSGPGFIDEEEYLIRPFFTRKPDGMGLGLFLANEVMEGRRGALRFSDSREVQIPEIYKGAVVILDLGEHNA